MRTLERTISKLAIFSASFLLSLISSSVFLPINPTSAAQSQTPIALTISPVISLTTDATNGVLSIPITPSSTGTLGTSNLTISIHTNNPTGYTLTMSTATTNTNLTHTVEPTHTIPSTTAPVSSPSTLTTNTWGYSKWTPTQISNNTPPTTFSSIPSLSTPENIATTSDQTADPDTKLTFAANASSTIASGTYTNTMLLTATANYVPQPPQCPVLTGKTYLQDITVPTGPIYGQPNQRTILKDRRNNQDYYVQNILNQDGTCTAWMETNLRYAGDGNWNSSWGYDDDRYATSTTNDTDNTNDDARPLTMTSSGWFGGSSTNAYTIAGVADAGGSNTLDTTNPTNNTLFYGYLYNWCSAMGGQTNACNNTTGTPQSNFDTAQSICPAGWRLPTGGGATTTDWKNLTNAIGATSNAVGSTILQNDFLAVYSGGYGSGLDYQGTNGNYWSSTVAVATYSYLLSFSSIVVDPGMHVGSKYLGQSIRCVL